jgi:hypothetical protein
MADDMQEMWRERALKAEAALEDALSAALILWARSEIESTFDPSHEPRRPS